MNIIPMARAAGFGAFGGLIYGIADPYINGRRITPIIDMVVISTIISIAVEAIALTCGLGAITGVFFGLLLSIDHLKNKEYLRAAAIMLASGVLGGFVEFAHVKYGVPLI